MGITKPNFIINAFMKSSTETSAMEEKTQDAGDQTVLAATEIPEVSF